VREQLKKRPVARPTDPVTTGAPAPSPATKDDTEPS
jgi:hypothetical protein